MLSGFHSVVQAMLGRPCANSSWVPLMSLMVVPSLSFVDGEVYLMLPINRSTTSLFRGDVGEIIRRAAWLRVWVLVS